MPSICGTCGSTHTDEYGRCKNGHDHWVELRDFEHHELQMYVAQAALNLGLSLEELRLKVKSDTIGEPYYCKFYKGPCKESNCPACKTIQRHNASGEIYMYKHCLKYKDRVVGMTKIRSKHDAGRTVSQNTKICKNVH